jgi:hypothetical protein
MYKILAIPYQTVSPNLDVQQALSSVAVFIIPDIHGSIEKLDHLLTFIRFYDTQVLLKFLGDYVDKGLSSRETLEFILNLKQQHPKRVTLLGGNHELFLMQRNYRLAFEIHLFTQNEIQEDGSEVLVEDSEDVNWLKNEDDAEKISQTITDMFADDSMQASDYLSSYRIFLSHAGLDLNILQHISQLEPRIISKGRINFSVLNQYFIDTIKMVAHKEQKIATLRQAAKVLRAANKKDRAEDNSHEREIRTSTREYSALQFEGKMGVWQRELNELYEKHPIFWFRKVMDGNEVDGTFWANAARLFGQYDERSKEKRAHFGKTTHVTGHSVVPYFDRWSGWDVRGIIATPDGSFVVTDGGMADCFYGNISVLGITPTGQLLGFVKDSDDLTTTEDWYCSEIKRCQIT